jgi:hypothetical protein
VTAQNPPALGTSPATRSNLLWTLVRFREAGISVFILILVVAITLRSPSFLTVDNFEDILLNISILTIVALAQAMVIITRGIDLSVSSMIGLVAMMVAFVVKQNPEMPVLFTVLLGMALGAVLGTFNGLIITVGRVPPIIATLGTLSIYRGLVFFYSQGTWINSFELPRNFKLLSKGTLRFAEDGDRAIVVAASYYFNYIRTGYFCHRQQSGRGAVCRYPQATDHLFGLFDQWSAYRAGGCFVGISFRIGANQHGTRLRASDRGGFRDRRGQHRWRRRDGSGRIARCSSTWDHPECLAAGPYFPLLAIGDTGSIDPGCRCD